MNKKTTLYLGEEEATLLKLTSAQEGISQGVILTRALRSYFRSRARKSKSIGAGHGRRDLSEKVDALLHGLGTNR